MLICMGLVVLLPAQDAAPLPGGPDHVIAQVRELCGPGWASPANRRRRPGMAQKDV